MKVTTIGAALVDIYFASDGFAPQVVGDEKWLCQPYGHKIEILDHDVTTGGAGTNVAVAMARRGHDVSIVAEVGGDNFASLIKNELVAERVNTHYLVQEPAEKTGCSVILRGTDGGRTIMVSRSASAMLDDYDIDKTCLLEQDWCHLSSLGGNAKTLAQIWRFLKQGKFDLSWNPGSKELKALMKGELDLPPVKRGVFLVNREEWEMVAGRQEEILAQFRWVVVTAGKATGRIYEEGKLRQEFEPKSKRAAFEETGAGDAFASAFVSTLLYGRPLAECLMAALNNADGVIKYIGAKKGLQSF
jgi:ribokinase